MSIVVESLPPAAPETRRLYTYEELIAEMAETNQPHELWDGELIMAPAPCFDHQKTVLRFCRRLDDWVSSRKLGEVIASPIDMVLSPHRAVQPDGAFVAKDRLAMSQRAIMGPADLVAEVSSLGGRNRDRIAKRDLYEQYGVREYWMIDPESETVEVLALVSGRYELVQRSHAGETATSRLLPGFDVSVNYLFRAAGKGLESKV
ncbi:MAG: Uma2 family endonuclease [Verrucomicrobia bacterium]|nr:Uma2 family endonuclease [Verrucomicrobiota bacterium]